jgi:benzodiazapine receptor
MKKFSTYQIITILTTLMTITVNALANILPINGQGTGEIADRFAIYFVPAGYVFSIWGLIYLGLITFTIYQALPSERDNQTIKKILPTYWISNFANTTWIFLWHYEIFSLTLVAMVAILISLVYISIQLSDRKADLAGNVKLFVRIPVTTQP